MALWLIACKEAGPAIVDCYGKGQAVEYFMVSHGLFGSDSLFVVEMESLTASEEVSRYVPPSEEIEKHYSHIPLIDQNYFIDLITLNKPDI